MDLALALLVLWALLFMPIGLALHGLVLGPAARVRALPLAPVTGIATAIVVLSVLARLGIDAGQRPVAWGVVIASIASAIVIWRARLAWRSRELVGSAALLLLAVLLVQLPVIGVQGDGPLGYGTAADPVEEVASIDAAVGGNLAEKEIAREAAGSADDRPVGFEQFAALTVAIGNDDSPIGGADSWTGYALHAPITGILAALLALPLFAFARARGVRWFGLLFLVPVGVLAPYTFLALANGTGAAIATLPCFAAAVFSLLVTRRDRGWWSLAMLFGAAMAAAGGALAILPLITVGIAWVLLRATTYEHLAQADTPVGSFRALAPGVVATVLAIFSLLPTLATGALLAWPRLHDTVADAVRSWPFAWLDTDLSTTGPNGGVETAIWLAGPALLFIAAVHSVIRNERRELAVLLGATASALIALVVAAVERDAGIRLLEYCILAASPLLASLAVRGVALAREHAEDAASRGRIARIAGWAPVLLIVGFVLVSLASTSVTGSRMVHAPQLQGVSLRQDANIVIAGGDQWLEFVLDGTRFASGSIDADALATRPRAQQGDVPSFAPWDTVVLGNSPLGSDPPSRFAESSSLDSYQARLFTDRTRTSADVTDVVMQSELQAQREYRAVAEQGDARAAGATARQQAALDEDAGVVEEVEFDTPLRHDPLEGENRRVTPGKPAGLLLPREDVPGCTAAGEQPKPCEPEEPVVARSCTDEDVAAARSPLEAAEGDVVKADSEVARLPSGSGVVSVAPDIDSTLRPPLLGVQCFDVQVDPRARVLLLHLRNVGLIFGPETAEKSGNAGDWQLGGDALSGPRWITSVSNARIAYGRNRLASGSFDVTVEGSFGAGVDLEGGLPTIAVEGEDGTERIVEEVRPFASLRGAADGFGSVARDAPLQGRATLRNTSGTDVEFGRLFARPRDIPPSCDIALGIAAGQTRELRLESDDTSAGAKVQRPGITVTVVDATGTGEARTARVVVGSYLTFAGLPRFVLLDWTEQYAEPLETEGCDGVKRIERGTAPPRETPTRRGGDEVVGFGAPTEQ